MMRKGSAAITPGVARVRLLPVIEPRDYGTREDLLRAVREEIAEALPEEMKPVAG
jgi:1-acyl-sn-glycerol-3-phosphate acyltransferase